jgi:hypothetical protein
MNREAFPLPLCVRELADGSQYHFETETDFVYLDPRSPIVIPGHGPAWIVPQGFRTDFASVPGLFRGLLDSDNLVSPAALIHDWLYSSQLVDRSTADAVFRSALLANGLPAWKARVYWLGVRAGGWTKWGKRPGEASDMLEALGHSLDRRGA